MNHKQDQTFSPPTLLFSFSHLRVFFVSIIMLVTLLKVYHRWWITRGQTGSFLGFCCAPPHSLALSGSLLSVSWCVSARNPHNVSRAGGGGDSLCLLMRKGKDESGEEGVGTTGCWNVRTRRRGLQKHLFTVQTATNNGKNCVDGDKVALMSTEQSEDRVKGGGGMPRASSNKVGVRNKWGRENEELP